MALVAMAISDLGFTARSFTGSQAGVITDSVHGKAKIIDVTPGRITQAIGEGHIVIVAGFQGVSADTKEITTLGRGGTDTTAVALAAALEADVCEIYTDVDGVFTADPRIVPSARKLDKVSYEEMLELAACGSKILHLRCVEYGRRYGIPIHVRSSFSQLEGTWVVNDPRSRRTRGRHHGTAHHRRSRPRRQRGQDHRRRRARQGGRGRPHLRGAGRRPDQPRHDRAEHLRGRDEPDRHLLHAAAHRRPDRDDRARADPGRGRLRQAALRRQDRQGLADRRRHALAPGHHLEVLRRPRLGRRQHRDDLHLRDPDLGRSSTRTPSTTPSAPPTRRSTWTPTRSRPWSTEAPGDDRQHRHRRRHRTAHPTRFFAPPLRSSANNRAGTPCHGVSWSR